MVISIPNSSTTNTTAFRKTSSGSSSPHYCFLVSLVVSGFLFLLMILPSGGGNGSGGALRRKVRPGGTTSESDDIGGSVVISTTESSTALTTSSPPPRRAEGRATTTSISNSQPKRSAESSAEKSSVVSSRVGEREQPSLVTSQASGNHGGPASSKMNTAWPKYSRQGRERRDYPQNSSRGLQCSDNLNCWSHRCFIPPPPQSSSSASSTSRRALSQATCQQNPSASSWMMDLPPLLSSSSLEESSTSISSPRARGEGSRREETICLDSRPPDVPPPLPDLNGLLSATSTPMSLERNLSLKLQEFKHLTSYPFKNWWDWPGKFLPNAHKRNRGGGADDASAVVEDDDGGEMSARYNESTGVYMLKNVCVRPRGKLAGYKPRIENRYMGVDETYPLMRSKNTLKYFRQYINDVNSMEKLPEAPSHFLDSKVIMMPLFKRCSSEAHVLMRLGSMLHIKEKVWGRSAGRGGDNEPQDDDEVVTMFAMVSPKGEKELGNGGKVEINDWGASAHTMFTTVPTQSHFAVFAETVAAGNSDDTTDDDNDVKGDRFFTSAVRQSLKEAREEMLRNRWAELNKNMTNSVKGGKRKEARLREFEKASIDLIRHHPKPPKATAPDGIPSPLSETRSSSRRAENDWPDPLVCFREIAVYQSSTAAQAEQLTRSGLRPKKWEGGGTAGGGAGDIFPIFKWRSPHIMKLVTDRLRGCAGLSPASSTKGQRGRPATTGRSIPRASPNFENPTILYSIRGGKRRFTSGPFLTSAMREALLGNHQKRKEEEEQWPSGSLLAEYDFGPQSRFLVHEMKGTSLINLVRLFSQTDISIGMWGTNLLFSILQPPGSLSIMFNSEYFSKGGSGRSKSSAVVTSTLMKSGLNEMLADDFGGNALAAGQNQLTAILSFSRTGHTYRSTGGSMSLDISPKYLSSILQSGLCVFNVTRTMMIHEKRRTQQRQQQEPSYDKKVRTTKKEKSVVETVVLERFVEDVEGKIVKRASTTGSDNSGGYQDCLWDQRFLTSLEQEHVEDADLEQLKRLCSQYEGGEAERDGEALRVKEDAKKSKQTIQEEGSEPSDGLEKGGKGVRARGQSRLNWLCKTVASDESSSREVGNDSSSSSSSVGAILRRWRLRSSQETDPGVRILVVAESDAADIFDVNSRLDRSPPEPQSAAKNTWWRNLIQGNPAVARLGNEVAFLTDYLFSRGTNLTVWSPGQRAFVQLRSGKAGSSLGKKGRHHHDPAEESSHRCELDASSSSSSSSDAQRQCSIESALTSPLLEDLPDIFTRCTSLRDVEPDDTKKKGSEKLATTLNCLSKRIAGNLAKPTVIESIPKGTSAARYWDSTIVSSDIHPKILRYLKRISRSIIVVPDEGEIIR